MPPHIEVETHSNDDWSWLTSASSTTVDNGNNNKLNNDNNNNNTDLSSPLFRDDDSNIPPPPSRLDRRQSDPDFTALVKHEEKDTHITNKPLVAPSPVVSRITAIIGPESAYVNVRTCSTTTNNVSSSSNNTPPSITTSTSISKKEPIVYKNGIPQKKKSPSPNGTNCENKDSETNLLRRATKLVSKKGWKVVKSLPNKLMSTFKSVKIPGVHKNVV